MSLFFRTFWRNSVFWLLFVFSLFCCRSFFVVTCIVNWLMTGFFLWFCSKIVHRRAVLVIIAPHLKCTYMHAFPALGLYFLQRFLWIKLNHNNNKLLIRTRKKILCQCTQELCLKKSLAIGYWYFICPNALAPGVVQWDFSAPAVSE